MVAYTNYRRDPRVRRQAEALVEAGHDVTFLASRHAGDAPRQRVSAVELLTFRGLGNRKTSALVYMADYALFFLRAFLHMSVRPRRYALIHVNNMPDFLVFSALVPKLFGRPVIHDIHDLMPEIYAEKFRKPATHWMIRTLAWQERWAARFASRVITVEERLKDILGARGIDRRRIHVLMNLPDDRIFAKRRCAPARGPADPLVLIYHGTLARRLGLDVAIRAVALVARESPGVRFRIIGAGEERDALIDLARELQLGESVSFSEGFVPLEEIPGRLEDADVGIVPLRKSDGTDIMLPTKLLEYVSVGIPCIVPATGTIRRYFDAEMVEFFEAEDVESLAGAIRRLRDDIALRQRLAQQSFERFASRFSWSQHRRTYIDLVENLITGESA